MKLRGAAVLSVGFALAVVQGYQLWTKPAAQADIVPDPKAHANGQGGTSIAVKTPRFDTAALPQFAPTPERRPLPDIALPPVVRLDFKIPEVDPEKLCRPVRLFRTVVEGKGKKKKAKKVPYTADLVDEDKFAAVVARVKGDGNLEWIAGANALDRRVPASLTKLMTAALIFERLKNGTLKETDPVTFSTRARAMPRSNLADYRARLGNTWTVRDALMGMMMKSGNDAAVALGELIAADETRLGQVMTTKARSIGMRNTVFKNASGWTDAGQYTTAAETILLMHYLYQAFPEYKGYLGTRQWPVSVAAKKPMVIHNAIGHIQQGAIGPIRVDGAKSGTLDASGLNMIVSGLYGNQRIYIVVMGGEDRMGRNRCMGEIARKFVTGKARPS